MNTTGSKAGSFVVICSMNEMVWKQEYQVEKVVFAMTTIILNILSFPVTILMNALVIMAVKTRTRLQSKYNTLQACLAGTDLLVGAATQPTFIAAQIYVIKGLSLTASLFHLTLVSFERFVAIKYTFRYMTTVTGRRLKIAVVSSWVIACFPAILESFSGEFKTITRVAGFFLVVLSLSLILFCHLSVYFATRRHEKEI